MTTNESFGYSFLLNPGNNCSNQFVRLISFFQGHSPTPLIRAHLKLRKSIVKLAAVDEQRIVILCRQRVKDMLQMGWKYADAVFRHI